MNKTNTPAALTQEPVSSVAWAEAQRVCDLPEVDEAIRGLIEDNTGDNATCLVRAVLEVATQPAASVASGGETVVARAIWSVRREEEDRCDLELEDLEEEHPVWEEAKAVIAATAQLQPRTLDAPVSDESINAIWDSIKPQGDPTGRKFALAFAHKLLEAFVAGRAPVAQTAPVAPVPALPTDETTQHLKDIYAFLASIAPSGIADEAFRNVPDSILPYSLRAEKLSVHLKQSNPHGKRLGLTGQDNGTGEKVDGSLAQQVTPPVAQAEPEIMDHPEFAVSIIRVHPNWLQNYNPGVRVTHTPIGVFAESTTERSQHANHAIALRELRAKILAAQDAKDADSRDAGRYRRIRNGPHSDRHGDLYAMTFQGDGDVPVKGEELDRIVDAAIKAKDATP